MYHVLCSANSCSLPSLQKRQRRRESSCICPFLFFSQFTETSTTKRVLLYLPIPVLFPVYRNVNDEESPPVSAHSCSFPSLQKRQRRRESSCICQFLFFAQFTETSTTKRVLLYLPIPVLCPVYRNVNDEESLPVVSVSTSVNSTLLVIFALSLLSLLLSCLGVNEDNKEYGGNAEDGEDDCGSGCSEINDMMKHQL